jgi:hypothetical protein
MESGSQTFLIERIRRQAQAEGVPLSQEEEMFLESVTTGHKEEARAALKNLKEHESMLEFGRRMVGLLMRAYEEDVKADPQAKERYTQHSEYFAQGPNIFSAVLPLIAGRSHEHHQQQDVVPQQPDITPPVVEPKSSFGGFLLLVFLIAVGLILWIVLTRR